MITQFDFEELKRYFDQNDTYGGANYLSGLLRRHGGCAADLIQQYQGTHMQTNYSAGQGLTLHQFHNGFEDVQTLGVDPSLLDDIYRAQVAIPALENTVFELQEEVRRLKDMHTEGGEHIPTIISTVEQVREMQDKIDAEEKVLVETSFSRAMEIIK